MCLCTCACVSVSLRVFVCAMRMLYVFHLIVYMSSNRILLKHLTKKNAIMLRVISKTAFVSLTLFPPARSMAFSRAHS